MTVKEIFELRKQGRSEEAYKLIIPMYKEHQGHYTTICMFWCASDVLRNRLAEVAQAENEAEREEKSNEAFAIFLSMQRLYPNMDDKDGLGMHQLYHHAYRLHKYNSAFSLLLFLSAMGLAGLTDIDWTPTEQNGVSHPSFGSLLLAAAFADYKRDPTRENAERLLPLLEEGRRRQPSFQRYADYITACKSLL